MRHESAVFQLSGCCLIVAGFREMPGFSDTITPGLHRLIGQ